MSFLRNVLHDLIEKRLWPVAIALVAALVAVPVVLGGSSDAGTATPAPVADASANGLVNHRDAAGAEVVSLEEQAAGKVQRKGAVHDPFVQHHQPKPVSDKQVKEAVKKVAGALNDALSGSSNGGTGGSSPSSGSPVTPALTPAPAATTPVTTVKKPTVDEVFGVRLKFGEAGAEKTYDNVARLTPLPSSDNPFFVYLGLQDDKKHAVFLINEGAAPSGDGHCLPSPQQCEQVTLGEGDIEFFELQSGTAGVVE